MVVNTLAISLTASVASSVQLKLIVKTIAPVTKPLGLFFALAVFTAVITWAAAKIGLVRFLSE